MLHLPKDTSQYISSFAESSLRIPVVSGAPEDNRSAVGNLAKHESRGDGEPGFRVEGEPVLIPPQQHVPRGGSLESSDDPARGRKERNG